jgi:hypothetical protein
MKIICRGGEIYRQILVGLTTDVSTISKPHKCAVYERFGSKLFTVVCEQLVYNY